MITVSLTMRDVRLPDTHQGLVRLSDEAAHRAARVTRDRARAAVRRKRLIGSGRGHDSITYQRRGAPGLTTTYQVGPPIWYMVIQERGTGPIYPVRAKALRFRPKGKNYFVFAKRTKGVPAGRFMREARNRLTTQDFLPGPGRDLQ